MGTQIFDRLFVFKDGALLGMADSATVEWQGDPIVVDTLSLDFAGVYPVPKHSQMSVDQFVPVDATNFDPTQAWIATEVVTMKAQLGGSGLVFESDGFILAPSITSSPTNPTKISFKAVLEAKPFQ